MLKKGDGKFYRLRPQSVAVDYGYVGENSIYLFADWGTYLVYDQHSTLTLWQFLELVFKKEAIIDDVEYFIA